MNLKEPGLFIMEMNVISFHVSESIDVSREEEYHEDIQCEIFPYIFFTHCTPPKGTNCTN